MVLLTSSANEDNDDDDCGNMIACRDPGSNRGPSDLQSDALPSELSRLVTNPTNEPVIVAQRRAGKTTTFENATELVGHEVLQP